MLAQCGKSAWKRRHRFEVIACILREASDWSTKTRLVYRTGLNFHVLAKYLGFLTSRGLLEQKQVDTLTLYRTTEKGRLWLTFYTRALELLENR